MKFHVLTLFPEMIIEGLSHSITGRALKKGLINISTINIRDFCNNKHGQVDDYIYGGGHGMLMQPAPVYNAYKSIVDGNQIKKPKVVFMTPQGKTFNQEMAKEFSKEEDLIFLCGHYEGIDERVLDMIVTDNVSLGDFVLTGGELPVMTIIDSVSRLIPGVLGSNGNPKFRFC